MKQSPFNAWVLTGSLLSAWLCAAPIAAQVIPDNTLPVGERSQVTGNPNVQIDGGARRGGNLFHSFSQFSIPTGSSAYFNNAADVQNIFSRVTGGSVSNIDGVLRANGTANLFLLNPNGILFGANASLNIGGSFVGTTATAIGFPNGEVFSSDATQPLPSQLLTVNPNAFFFNQSSPQPIINESTADGAGLQVPVKQNLLLVGGSVQFDNGGRIASPGSYVAIGSVGGIGTVGLSTTSEDWQLSIPNNVERADVALRNDSRINVLGGGGGSIAVTARNVSLSEKSRFRVGIDADLGFAGAQTGGIQIDATETIKLVDGATFRIEVLPGGKGNVGDMTITTGSLFLTGNSRLIAAVSGQGTVGGVTINARDTVSFDYSYVFGAVQDTAIGSNGGISITTGSFALKEGSQLIFNTLGQGNAGDITIHARDRVSVDGESLDGAFASTIASRVQPGGVGQGGNLVITTGSLALTNGGAVNTATDGQGNAGSVTIQARDSIEIRGRAAINAENRSGIFTTATEESVGNGGDVTITTGSLSVSQQGQIITDVRSQGNAGNIQIHASDAVSFDGGDAISTLSTGGVGRGADIEIAARSLSVLNNAQLSSATAGEGNAGNITASADTVNVNSGGRLLTTTSSNGRAGDITVKTPDLQLSGANSGLFADTTSTGAAGNLTIQPQGNGQSVRVNLQDGAQISASTSSSGQGGDLLIAAPESITLTGNGSVIAAGTGGSGAGGNLNLRTNTLNIQNQAEVTVSSVGTGSAGSLFVDADQIYLDNQGSIRAGTSGSGAGGNLNLRTRTLNVQNQSEVTVSSAGTGSAGSLFVNADQIYLDNQGSIRADTTGSGAGGNLNLRTRNLNIQNQAEVTVSSSGTGSAGNLFVNADRILLNHQGSIRADTTGGGAGGNLTLTTGTLNIQNRAEVTVSSSGSGTAGNLFVNADRILLNNQGSIRADTTGGGGNINLRSPFILLRNGSNITTNARGANIPGGNITIDTRFLIAVLNEDSNISANSEDFRGGNINIKAFSIFGIQPRPNPTPLSDITATGTTSALSGTINVITAGIDPTAGLVALPTDLVDASGLIAQGCPANQGNSFVMSGRGGLPPTPEQQLDDDAGWSDQRRLTVTEREKHGDAGARGRGEVSNSKSPDTRHPTPDTPILEATGWQMTPTGEIFLIATTPDPTVHNPLKQPISCQGRR